MARRRTGRVVSRGCVLLGLLSLGLATWLLVDGALTGIPLVVVGLALLVLATALRRRRISAGGRGPDSPGGAGAMVRSRPRNPQPTLSARAVADTSAAASA